MAWVCAKILGDGLSPETAWHTAPQRGYDLQILNSDHIPMTNPEKGRSVPVQPYALLEIADEQAKKLEAEKNAFVFPPDKILDQTDKVQLTDALSAQACVVDLSATKDVSEVISKVMDQIAQAQVADGGAI